MKNVCNMVDGSNGIAVKAIVTTSRGIGERGENGAITETLLLLLNELQIWTKQGL